MKKSINGLLGLATLCFLFSFTPGGEKSMRKGKDIALFFAIQNYQNWSDLQFPVDDANTIAGILRNDYDFDTKVITDANQETIIRTLRGYIDQKYDPDAQLLVFFSGHGDFDPVTKEGFFIPQDARSNDLTQSSYLSFLRLQNFIKQIPCRHILLAIDACYSGTFDKMVAMRGEPDFGRPGEGDGDERGDYIRRELQLQSRFFVASGKKERTPDQSEFASRFKKALRDKGGSDNIVSFSELAEELKKAQPRPFISDFEGNEQESNFLFVGKEPAKVPVETVTDRAGATTPPASGALVTEAGLDNQMAKKTVNAWAKTIRSYEPNPGSLRTPAPSPGCELEQWFGNASISISYSSISLKDRKFFGDIIPYGEKWRTGANASTKITFNQSVTIGGQVLDKGTYALYSLPGEKEWIIYFYKNTNFPAIPGPKDWRTEDVAAEITVKPEFLSKPVENLVFIFDNIQPGRVNLNLLLEKMKIPVPIELTGYSNIKDTKDKTYPYMLIQDVGLNTVSYIGNDRVGENAASGVFLIGKKAVANGIPVEKGAYKCKINATGNTPTLTLYPLNFNDLNADFRVVPLVVPLIKASSPLPLAEDHFSTAFLRNNYGIFALQSNRQKWDIKIEVDTDHEVMAQIDAAIDLPYVSANFLYGAARYYFDEKKDMKKALEWVNKSIEKDYERFWVLRLKAQIQAELGQYKEAIETANRSTELAKTEGNTDYPRMNEISVSEWQKKL